MNSNTLIKKTGALVLIGAMFFSLCGCSMFSKKDVLAAAREVAENIEDFDADRLLSLSTLSSGSDKAEDLRKGLNGDYLDENTLKFCTAVRKTISFQIKEDTFTAKGKEASVDIEFKLADYKSVLKKDYKNIDELVSAVRNSDDTVKVTYTAKFVKEDGEWLLDNLMGSSFLSIFEFMDADIGALAVDLSKAVKGSGWGDAGSDGYENAKKLSLKVEFSSDITKLAGKGVKMTYSVEKDGKKVWTSDAIELGNDTSIQLDYGTEQNPGAEMKSNCLAAGKYKFTLTADNGTVMHSADVDVKVTIKETTTPSTTSKGYKFYDSNFASKVLNASWANVDQKRVSAASYGSDAAAVSFQFQVDPVFELFIPLGETLEESMGTLRQLQEHLKQPVGQTIEIQGCLSLAYPNDEWETVKVTTRQFLFSKLLEFSLERDGYIRATHIARSEFNSLVTSAGFYQKLHPNEK